jgi:hypothetical protein
MFKNVKSSINKNIDIQDRLREPAMSGTVGGVRGATEPLTTFFTAE